MNAATLRDQYAAARAKGMRARDAAQALGVSEGEATIVRPDGVGGFTVVGRVQAADWPKLAKAN